MAYEVQVTANRLAERYFKCSFCGARGEASFRAVGRSGWARESMFNPTSAHHRAGEQAQHDLTVDEERTLRLVRCPTCQRRAPGAMTWVVIRPGFWVALALVAPLLLSVQEGVWTTILCLGVAVFFASRELSRLRRARVARIDKLVPGTLPTPKPRPPRPVRPDPLPRARAIAAPPLQPAPIPVAIAPPPPPPPRTASDEPAFLRDSHNT